MKHSKLSLLMLSIFALLLATGCDKKDDLVDCAPATTSPSIPASAVSNLSLAEFSRRNSVAVQTFSIEINGSQAQTITTAAGAKVTLPDTFMLPNGLTRGGSGTLKLREIYTVPDMVLANMPTNQLPGGDMLVSGGEFNIQVSQGSQRLRLTAGSLPLVLQSPIPTDQDTTPQYVWSQPASQATNSNTSGWLRSSASQVQQLSGYYRALIPLDSIGWWNIDQSWHLYQQNNSTTVTVNTPANTLADTRVYLRPVGFNGLSSLVSTGTAGTQWFRPMPVGSEVIAVVLQSVKGQLYYGTQRFVVQANAQVTPTLTPVNEAEAVRLIRQL